MTAWAPSMLAVVFRQYEASTACKNTSLFCVLYIYTSPKQWNMYIRSFASRMAIFCEHMLERTNVTRVLESSRRRRVTDLADIRPP